MNKILKLRLELVAFLISSTLLILAINSAWSVFMEGQDAARNAAHVLNRFDLIVLKTETTEPRITTESVSVPVEVVSAPIEMREKPIVEYSPIASINAERIGLSVSVLSEWSYELLDISVNKFSGPDPNEDGNLVVIGHNYLNKAHFGSLHLLMMGDLVKLTDLSGRVLTYEVYDIQIIKPDEVDKLLTDQTKTLTLVTCHADNQFRLVVKSKAIN